MLLGCLMLSGGWKTVGQSQLKKGDGVGDLPELIREALEVLRVRSIQMHSEQSDAIPKPATEANRLQKSAFAPSGRREIAGPAASPTRATVTSSASPPGCCTSLFPCMRSTRMKTFRLLCLNPFFSLIPLVARRGEKKEKAENCLVCAPHRRRRVRLVLSNPR